MEVEIIVATVDRNTFCGLCTQNISRDDLSKILVNIEIYNNLIII